MLCTVADFRRCALALPNAIESSHMGHPDFRLVDARGDARIFATLSAQDKGCGVLKLTLEQQQAFLAEMPEVFSPVHGGWGRMGMTFLHLAAADEAILQGALATAHRNVEMKQLSKPAARAKKAVVAPKKAEATPKQILVTKKVAAPVPKKSAVKSGKAKPVKAKSPRR